LTTDPFRGTLGPVRIKEHSRWRADLRWGAMWAGGAAAVYSLYVLLLTVLRWSTYWPQYKTSTWRIIGAYWCAAAVLTVVLASLRPILDRRWGAALAGALGGATVYGVIALSLGDPSSTGVAVACAGFGALGGLGLGVVFYDDEYGELISEKRERRRIAILVAGGVVALFIIWAMCYPPLCLLGGRYCS